MVLLIIITINYSISDNFTQRVQHLEFILVFPRIIYAARKWYHSKVNILPNPTYILFILTNYNKCESLCGCLYVWMFMVHDVTTEPILIQLVLIISYLMFKYFWYYSCRMIAMDLILFSVFNRACLL